MRRAFLFEKEKTAWFHAEDRIFWNVNSAEGLERRLLLLCG